jgi:phosphatidylserine/phosphatidylglycerophosphate/cardiolipin synthase-like enzyme
MQEALLSLSPHELRTLAAGLRTGRLSEPYSTSGLTRFLQNDAALAVSGSLQIMAHAGMQRTGIAHSLELLASALSERPSISDLVDLVTTGPSAGTVANRDTSVVVSDLFRNAKSSVLLAGYAVYGGRTVFHALGERMLSYPTLKVRMFLDIQRKPGDTSTSEEIVNRFARNFRNVEWPEQTPLPEIYYDPRSLSVERVGRAVLHAKCVVVDAQQSFVSSANFTEAAQQRNVEVGVLLRSGAIANRLTQFFDSLLQARQFHRAV